MRQSRSSISRSKKALIAIAAVVALAASYLFAFSLISTSHPISKAAIAQSPDVAASVGKLAGVILIGSRQKHVPGGLSCGTNTYLVFGNAGWAVVTSALSMPARQHNWQVSNLSLGWFNGTHWSC
ncbi:hypothetical protein [Roseateles sp. BYS96W]|uniref:Uncharacterized protein n=1 Tax=Pelomonas nitida TaxID=3299027 RepID=A0ABW7GC37_9BURK